MDFKIVPSKQAREAISVGYQNHWRFRVVNENSYKRDWVTETLSEAPVKAQERIQTLKKSGISIQGFVVAHEAPRLLTAPMATPSVEPQPKTQPVTSTANFPITEILIFMFTMFFQAILLDPAIIAVLDDGTWLEIMTYYE
jgi:hypothetical protein